MIEDLCWNNYLELNDYLKNKNFNFDYFSTIQLIQWQYYGSKFKFHKLDQVVIFYIKIKEFKNWKLFNSFYMKGFNLEETIKVIKNDLNILNNNSNIEIIDFSHQSIKDWKLEDYQLIQSNYISNYIYNLESLKTFSGKRMVKKRNHLNAFLKQNYNVDVQNLKDANFNEIIEFTLYLNNKYSNESRKNEVQVYKEFLFNQYKKDKRFNGTVFYIDKKMVGYTFGFINKNIYEIIIEKAEKDIRGLYQFIIKSNLIFHNIKCELIDREDDLGNPMIAKSKHSYHPIEEVKRFCIKKVKW